MENRNLEQQTSGHYNDSQRFVDSVNQNQVIGKNIDDKTRKTVVDAVVTVQNQMLDAILTAKDKIVTPRVEMAVRSITGSAEQGLNSVVQNFDQRDFKENTDNNPLLSASSQLDLNIDQDRIDGNRGIENLGDGDFPVLKSNYDRNAHTHHMATKQESTLIFSQDVQPKTTH